MATNNDEQSVLAKLIFGTASLSSHASLKKAMAILNEAFVFGIKHFDTAAVYGKGYSEAILGKFIRDKRDKVILTTKFGLGNPKGLILPPLLALPLNYASKKIKKAPPQFFDGGQQLYSARIITKEDIAQQLQGSLSRLKTAYIDYYLLHEALPCFLTEEALAFLMAKKEAGIIRHLGLAANSLNTNSIAAETLTKWDVLQYDVINGKNIEVGYNSHLIHFHHSILKNGDQQILNEISPKEVPGYLIAKRVKQNSDGKVIFTTRNKKRLSENIFNFLKFSSNSFQNAIL